MAGIGFALRKLTRQDNLLGIVMAYSHAAVASSGPWLFTVLALGSIYPFLSQGEQLGSVHLVIMYNFSFSLIITAPICLVATRFLADAIYKKDVTTTPTLMLLCIALVFALLLPLGLYYYFWHVDLPQSLRVSAVINLLLVSLMWVLSIYMTALKDYNAITWSYAFGMGLAVAATRWLGNLLGEAGLLAGFNVGLAALVFLLAGKVLVAYPYRLQFHIGFLPCFRRYWQLALGGLCYNAAIWADKLVMWKFAPESIALPSGMSFYPHYDGAMFLSYLTIIPAMAVFIFVIETNFFVHFQRFYQDIADHQPLSVIRANHRRVIDCMANGARNFFISQGTITVLVILLSAKIFGLLHADFLSIGIFRLGALGSFFHVLALFEIVLLSYFDCRRHTLWLQAIFLVANAFFTFITTQIGFASYGYGYFLASLLTFGLAGLVLAQHVSRLPYHAFITNNASTQPPPALAKE